MTELGEPSPDPADDTADGQTRPWDFGDITLESLRFVSRANDTIYVYLSVP